MRGFLVQSFARTAVQTVHDHGKLPISHGMKRSGLRQILRNKAVCIFVGSTPPGRIGFSEVRCRIEGVINEYIDNAGELNGYLKPVDRLFVNPVGFADGCVVIPAGYMPQIDRKALIRFAGRTERFAAAKVF